MWCNMENDYLKKKSLDSLMVNMNFLPDITHKEMYSSMSHSEISLEMDS